MMNHVYRLYVPGTVNGNIPATDLQKEIVDEYFVKMAELFGGVTMFPAIGGYVMNGACVREPVILLQAFSDSAIHSVAVRGFAAEIAARMTQECVACEYDGGMDLVSPPIAAKLAA